MVNITSCSRTDHSLITMKVMNQNNKYGPGVWKFNDSLLNSNKFCENMEKCLNKTKSINKKRSVNKTEKWEFTKKQCKSFTLKFTKNSKRSRNELLQNLHTLRHKPQMEKIDMQNEVNQEDTLTMINRKIKEIEDDFTKQ